MTFNSCPLTLAFDLGTFEGFNFRDQAAIDRNLKAEEVINWDHDQHGEAEFWPSGNNAGVSLVFSGRSAVVTSELLALNRVLEELKDDSPSSFIRIYYAIRIAGYDIETLTAEQVEDQMLHLFEGTSFLDLRKEAAYELFELYYPEEYKMWEKSLCDGLIFDEDRFLDSPTWAVEEVKLGNSKFLIIASQ